MVWRRCLTTCPFFSDLAADKREKHKLVASFCKLSAERKNLGWQAHSRKLGSSWIWPHGGAVTVHMLCTPGKESKPSKYSAVLLFHMGSKHWEAKVEESQKFWALCQILSTMFEDEENLFTLLLGSEILVKTTGYRICKCQLIMTPLLPHLYSKLVNCGPYWCFYTADSVPVGCAQWLCGGMGRRFLLL